MIHHLCCSCQEEIKNTHTIGRCLSAQLISCFATVELLVKVMQTKTEIVLQMVAITYFNYSKQKITIFRVFFAKFQITKIVLLPEGIILSRYITSITEYFYYFSYKTHSFHCVPENYSFVVIAKIRPLKHIAAIQTERKSSFSMENIFI